jgi:hypothetical protein
VVRPLICALLLFRLFPASAQPVLQVDVHPATEHTLRALDPIELNIALSLPSTETPAGNAPQTVARQLAIQSLKVTPEGTIGLEYGETDCRFQQRGLRAGHSLDIPCILYPRNQDIRAKLRPSLGAIFARSLILQVEVNYMEEDENYDLAVSKRVSVLPPLVAVFYGGMTGALLLALFRGLAPFHRAMPVRANEFAFSREAFIKGLYLNAEVAVRFVLVTFAWLILGGVCAIMIIILTKASTGDLSPIKIEINDFVGGVLVGILSFPVVTWLQKRLLDVDA